MTQVMPAVGKDDKPKQPEVPDPSPGPVEDAD